jgi:hypothetical protein
MIKCTKVLVKETIVIKLGKASHRKRTAILNGLVGALLAIFKCCNNSTNEIKFL